MSLHRFSRSELLIGRSGLDILRDKRVMICGVGGVGSYAAEALGRAGVGHITLVDFDDVCLTNINRQLHALTSTVGQPKVEVMARRLADINPKADIMPVKAFFSAENAEELLAPRPDYVLDAIDHFTAKSALITTCIRRDIPVISSMGAANKLDPTKIHVADISATHNCRMARSMRKILRQAGIAGGVQVVYSTEEHRELDPASSSACGADCICPNREDQVFRCEHRRVILGTISYIPSIFGLTMAGVVINHLLESHP
ncbi:ThiF family adenylyltransferase [Geobacter sp. SVR]|uniref:tRNA threonylcarbamoyladenosine dehydratase n=1 Tax=Geobacter sp. SVR TaxID=2495594 RepID=UPI00143EF811|nr:tRNA threonylcarbamoyladenosine dehydratase [Geobacter sp. SVR]BCS52405.1 tRNA cyclic N6-threonylcarbamoyladenosine(37) synthase TcdA [Geobacter sp. SVR]GCF87362.1 tRNA cyclic N6-threonylcarbamoyladenosine(37) synthase TcdA [Geobacter sp. SVR]